MKIFWIFKICMTPISWFILFWIKNKLSEIFNLLRPLMSFCNLFKTYFEIYDFVWPRITLIVIVLESWGQERHFDT